MDDPATFDRGTFDIAQICLNRHVTNSRARSHPQRNQPYCDQCGARTITECPNCGTSIRGYYDIPNVVGGPPYKRPAFCHECGVAFPWTAARIKAAKELTAELDGLTEEERTLNKSVDDIVKDTAETQGAATRFKKLLGKVAREGGAVLLDISKDVASETTRKVLWP